MKTQIMLLLAVILALTIQGQVPSAITAVTPGQISYQGRLLKENGTPYNDAVHDFEVRLYRADTGGTPIWGGKYTTYVKDGYFNLMLGGTYAAAPLTGTTYAYTNLWQALWYDASLPANERNALYLGIKPLKSETGGVLSSPTELAPRQVLQVSPFAFRAQTSEYANRSAGDFSAGGTLTSTYLDVTNGLSVSSKLLGGIPYEYVIVGGPPTQNTLTTIRGQLTNVGGSTYVYVTSTNNVYVEAGNEMYLWADMFDVTSSGDATITASSYLNLNANMFKGKGSVKWALPSSPTSFVSPFRVHHFVVTSTGGSTDPTTYNTYFNINDYTAVVVGCTRCDSGGNALTGSYSAPCTTMIESGTTWWIQIQTSRSTTYYYLVDVLFISKYFSTDYR